ncbi:MAG: hypothetical protein ACOZF2_15500 [Thermodesulfobacteriota bacterium]
MTKIDFVLKFEGPFGLTRTSKHLLFDHPVSKEPGLYLWTIPYSGGGYLVTYVGETSTSFWQRIKDHLIQTVGGNYRICDPDLLVRGEAKVLWNGLWRKGTRDKMPEYLERLEEFVPVMLKLLQNEIVFVAPFRSERRLRQRLEGAIAKHIKSQPAPMSSVLPSDVRYYHRRVDEAPIMVTIEGHCHVHGLPRELEV